MSQRRVPLMFYFCVVLLGPLLSRGNTISPGQVLKGKDAITSSGGNFTLGFFSPSANNTNTTSPSQKRYLGIWFTMIPDQTVVWVANRDSPVPANDASGGFLEFSGNGDLVVRDGERRVLWSTKCSSTNDSLATLEDNGNLVLRSNSSGVVKWQSFNDPSDTLLSGMDFSFDFEKKSGRLFRSWKSYTDPSTGSFAFGVDPKNVLQGVLWNGSVPVWRTGQWTGRSFSGIPEMSSYYLWADAFRFVTSENGTSFQLRVPFSVSSGYTRYVVKPEGRFALFSWLNKSGWTEAWAAPVNACATYGRCGPSSVCSEANLTLPACNCLPGFKPSGSGGCVRTTQLGCGRDDSGSSEDGFQKVASVKPPDGVVHFVEVDNGLDECRTLCLKNCSCKAHALVVEVGCITWFEEDLVDMQQLASGRGVDFYVRVAPSPSGKGRRNTLVIILSAVGCLGTISCFVCIYLSWRRQAKARGLSGELLEDQPLHASTSQEGRESGLPLFDLKTIMAATDNFSTTYKLGEGGFGPVYKGVLADGQEIAVKRLSKSSRQGFEEFMNEVEVIAKLQHKNLVRLFGCCVQGEEKILVYEYMPNKSLDFLLFDPTVSAPLDWERRFQIVMGTARGLQYLHQESRLRVVHRDLKASNILLDERMNPRISDFGLARIFGADQTQVNTNRVVGTYGYMSPEYALEGRFSTKSDVFSFGVIVLEILSGRKMTSFRHKELSLNLLGYAWKLWREDRMVDFLDPTLGGICNSDQLLRCLNVGLLCVQEGTADRPSMSSVVLMLSSELANLPQPKPPAYSLRTAPGDSDLPIFPDDEDPICSVNNVTVSILEPR